MTAVRTLVALGSGTGRDAVEAAFLGEARIDIVGFLPLARGAQDALGEDHEALLVACANGSPEALQFIADATRGRPDRPVVVAHAGNANGFVREAFAAGADDLVASDMPLNGQLGRDVAFAVQKALARRSGSAATRIPPKRAVGGEMIAMLGPKGGTGKTLTACNLAAALAAAGQRVVVVDLDLQFGDVGLAFGLAPERTIYDLATSGGTLDAEKLEDFLTEHESGVRVLLAPRRPDHAGAVTTEFLGELFRTLREMADFVVVDTPPAFSPEVIVSIDHSTSVCLVAMLDALSLKNTKLGLETLHLMGYDDSRVRIVLNRADSRVGVTLDDVAVLLGRAPDVRVPSSRDITRSVNEATPIVLTHGHAEARKAFELLATTYMPPSEPERGGDAPAPRRRRRLLRRARQES